MAASAKKPTYLDANRMYALQGFYQASGISATRVREARRKGIDLPTLNVGRRKFLRGVDAIEYIERLSQV